MKPEKIKGFIPLSEKQIHKIESIHGNLNQHFDFSLHNPMDEITNKFHQVSHKNSKSQRFQLSIVIEKIRLSFDKLFTTFKLNNRTLNIDKHKLFRLIYSFPLG